MEFSGTGCKRSCDGIASIKNNQAAVRNDESTFLLQLGFLNRVASPRALELLLSGSFRIRYRLL